MLLMVLRSCFNTFTNYIKKSLLRKISAGRKSLAPLSGAAPLSRPKILASGCERTCCSPPPPPPRSTVPSASLTCRSNRSRSASTRSMSASSREIFSKQGRRPSYWDTMAGRLFSLQEDDEYQRK
jgi:hypothetical protein